jgi:glucan 1,3-beta-glucosidase
MRLLSITICLWAASIQGAVLGKYDPGGSFLEASLLTSTPGPYHRRQSVVNSTSPELAVDGNDVAALATRPDGYWLNDLSGKGIAAFNPNPSGYKVFRNVKDYGAVGK